MRETVFEVSVVILIRLGMHDNGVIQPDLAHELHVFFQRLRWRLVRRVWRVREPHRIEQVNMRVDQQSVRPRGPEQRWRAHKQTSSGKHRAEHTRKLATIPRASQDGRRLAGVPLASLACSYEYMMREAAMPDDASI